jgi:nucleotide-binding universal stress UspA family protein
MRRLILGTTTDRVLRRARRPVLVVRQLPQVDYRRVMVAADFSAWSTHSIDLARRVAPDARLVLAHVVQVPYEEKLRYAGVEPATLDAYRVQAHAAAVQGLHALAEAAGLTPSQWEACVVEGDASLRLVEQEQLLDCDLIVLGKQGQSVAEDLLLGSVTAHVLAEGSADVLVTAVQAG